MSLQQPYEISRADVVKQARILIIEDDRIARAVLKQVFEDFGFCRIEEAVDGKDGLEKTRSFEPHLIILDINMPVMNGIEYCKRVRTIPAFRSTPILVQTSLSSPQERSKIFAAKATDYIAKPVEPDEIAARAFVHLKNIFLIQQLKAYNKKSKIEIQSARKMQRIIEPTQKLMENIAKTHSIQIKNTIPSTDTVSGSFWGARRLSTNSIAILDIHFLSNTLNAAINTFRMHTFLFKGGKTILEDPAECINALNSDLIRLLASSLKASIFYMIYDKEQHILRYALGGAHPPLLMRQGAVTAQPLEGSSCPIGDGYNTYYYSQTIKLHPGDTLFTYKPLSNAVDVGKIFPDVMASAPLLEDGANTIRQQCYDLGVPEEELFFTLYRF